MMNLWNLRSFAKRHLTVWAIMAATAVWFAWFAWSGIDPHHDGIMLKPAADVASGQILFRDTFTQYGALTVLIQSLAIRLGGEQLLAIRLATVLFYAASAGLLYRIWRDLERPGFVWLTMGMFWIFPPFYHTAEWWHFLSWSSVYALFFMLLALRWMMRAVHRGSGCGGAEPVREWLWAGAAAAAAGWCRQPAGLTLAACGATALLLHWRAAERWPSAGRRLGWLAAGAALPTIPMIGWLVWFEAFGDFWIQSFQFALRFGASDPSGAGGAWWRRLAAALFPVDTFYGLFPWLALGYGGWLLWKIVRRTARQRDWLLLAAVSVAGVSLHQYYPVPCIRHCYWAAIPAFGLLTLTVQSCRSDSWRDGRRWAAVLLLAALLPEGAVRLRAATRYAREFGAMRTLREPGPFAGIRLDPEAHRYWSEVGAAFDAVPDVWRGRRWLNQTGDGVYNLYFPVNDNAHPMYMNWGNAVYDNYVARTAELILFERPVIVALAPRPGYRVFRRVHNLDDQYFYLLLPLPMVMRPAQSQESGE